MPNGSINARPCNLRTDHTCQREYSCIVDVNKGLIYLPGCAQFVSFLSSCLGASGATSAENAAAPPHPCVEGRARVGKSHRGMSVTLRTRPDLGGPLVPPLARRSSVETVKDSVNWA